MVCAIKFSNENEFFQSKASLDIANLRGDTPLSMLHAHAGSIWIGQKVVEKVRELNQSTNRRNCLIRISSDKVRIFIQISLNFIQRFCFV